MPKERKKVLCMDAQRHAEYYGMQRTFDKLYAKSKAGETFTGLMELVLSPDNIMLAYRNIKPTQAATQQEQISRISVTSDGFHRLRSSVRSEKSSQQRTRLPSQTSTPERHSKAKRQNQAAGYSLHLGQIGAAMHQTNPGAHLRSKVQQQQLWVPPESVSGARNFPYLLPAATGAFTLCFGVRHQRIL